MRRPGRVLDLFCGAGGAAMGYRLAWPDAHITGVDLRNVRAYPFDLELDDALDYLVENFDRYDFIHASPPCQAYSIAAKSRRNAGVEYPDLVAATRDLLNSTGKPWVMENVPGAPLRTDIVLCGCMFGLQVRRIRLFETSWQHFELMPPCVHDAPAITVVGSGTPSWTRKALGHNVSTEQARQAMGMWWGTRRDLSQAVPPAYTRWIAERVPF